MTAAPSPPGGAEHPAAPLLALPRWGSGVGLHRMEWLVDEEPCASWLAAARSIGVTGSKGKGSAVRMTAAILSALGARTGTFISPHLLRWNERVAVDGVPVGDGELAELARWAGARVEAYQREFPADRVSRFEALTAIAVRRFALAGVGTAVFEAGIGGRLDPTRVVRPRVVGFTSLEIEHAELLGSSLELIAYDKAELCAPGGVLVLGRVDREVRRRLATFCRLRGVRLRAEGVDFHVRRVRAAEGATWFDLESPWATLAELRVPSPALYQAQNAVVAVGLAGEWAARDGVEVSPAAFASAVRRGLEAATFPGRFERVRDRPPVYVDIGHTPASAAALAESLGVSVPPARVLLVTGVSVDKDAPGILDALVPAAGRVIATRAYHNGRPAAEIGELVRARAPLVPLRVVPRIEDAVAQALREAAAGGLTVVVAGGLFLAMEAKETLRGGDPGGLRFG